MSVLLFAGPSLRPGDLDAAAGIELLPPARQGDIYRATCRQPRAIGLVDGFFDGVPAVSHKELLWALAQGIPVFGAASMGALRAAEMASFGMIGLGRIFADYRDGILTRDDEVALVHGPAETGYLGLSLPLVNLRATLDYGQRLAALRPDEAQALLAAGQAQFYQDRTWDSVLAVGLDPARAGEVRLWLRENRQDQKRADAQELVSRLRAHLEADDWPEPPPVHFEWTEAWAKAPWRIAGDPVDEAILTELRLEGDSYLETRRAALLRRLARQALEGAALPPAELAEAKLAFRLPLGLLRQTDLAAWCADNGLTQLGFEALIAERAGLEGLARREDASLGPELIASLREANRYADLRARASRKADLSCERRPAAPPVPVLIGWYFGTRLGRAVPEDLAAYAAQHGFAGLDGFCEALVAEYRLCAQS
ncbi:TfuA-like protein [Paracoccus aminophilus]|uniref:TfuA-like core domain-containing protein n=1 Tax=Paracoccus aminophilus JCM 7686 TaxID=1367847 RepID=S5Y273_PARAH|nr:TfuA-like protein [Paracoccus aminophilus]AGT09850.1 hypothetical protein JCM7686_2794 [Paracoccus aminophilus JCM 7686]